MSDVLDRTATIEVGAALGAAGDAVHRLAGAELWELGNGELTGAVQELHRLACRAQAQMLRMVAEVDVRGADQRMIAKAIGTYKVG